MRLPISLVFLLLGYWTLTGLQMDRFADDPGLGWHLLTGELIRDTHTIPRVDPFLAAPTPRPWIADQWLSDLLLAQILHLGGTELGMPLLYAVLTGVFLLTFMGITFFTGANYAGSLLLGGVAAFIALKLSTIHFILRPVIFAFFLFSLVMCVVWTIVRKVRNSTSVTVREVAILVPITLLWANIHPSFCLGVIVVGLTTIGLLYDTVIVERRPLDRRLFTLLGGVVLLMSLVSLVNPYGVDLLHQVFGLVSDDFFMNLNSEWKAIDPRSGEGQLFFTTVTLLALGACISPQRNRPLYFTELFVLGFLVCSTLTSIRFLPYFAIAAAPLLAVALKNLLAFEPLTRLTPYRRLGALLARADQRETEAWRVYGATLSLLVCMVCLGALHLGTVYPYRGPFGPSLDRFPYDGVAALSKILGPLSPIPPTRIAATPDWGGFLARSGGGAFKPVIDDRNSLLGTAPYKDYLASTTIGGDIAGYLQRVGARFLLLRANEPLAVYLRETGKLRERWRGEVSALFELPVGTIVPPDYTAPTSASFNE